MQREVRLLRVELNAALEQVKTAIGAVEDAAEVMGIPPTRMVDHNGSFIMIPLIVAKAQILAAFAQLAGR